MSEQQQITIRHTLGAYEIIVGSGELERIGERMHGLGLKGPVGIVSNNVVNDLYGSIFRSAQALRVGIR